LLIASDFSRALTRSSWNLFIHFTTFIFLNKLPLLPTTLPPSPQHQSTFVFTTTAYYYFYCQQQAVQSFVYSKRLLRVTAEVIAYTSMIIDSGNSFFLFFFQILNNRLKRVRLGKKIKNGDPGFR
jgi:hypothetical protein